MTITTETNKISHTYSLAVSQYPFDFPVLEESHLKVYEGEGSDLTSASYEITGLGDPAGGYIEFNGMTTPAVGNKITIVREVPYTQELDYQAYDPFPAESHEAAIDKLTMLLQQHAEELGRTMQSPITGESSEPLEVPAYVPNGVWMYDEAGNLVAIDIIAALEELAGETASRNRGVFTATQGQQVFDCGFRIQNEAVYYNGNLIPTTAYTITDGATIVESVLNLDVGCEYADDIIEVISTSSVMSTLLGAYLPLLGGTMQGGIKMNEDKAITFGLSGLSGIQRDLSNVFKIVNTDANPMQFGIDDEVVKQLNSDRSFSDWLLDAEVASTYREIKWISVNTTTKVFNIEVNGVAATISYT